MKPVSFVELSVNATFTARLACKVSVGMPGVAGRVGEGCAVVMDETVVGDEFPPAPVAVIR